MEFEKKMNEAVSRMKALDLMPQIIREFKNDRTLSRRQSGEFCIGSAMNPNG